MKPLILITNDDGIHSPGLLALAEAISDIADILIAAPIAQQTGMGRSFPHMPDTGIIEEVRLLVNGHLTKGYGIHGSPAQCVAYAILELADRKPDFVFCGVNYGENLGLSVTCSGTLGAAFEANSHRIKAIAFSRPTALSKQHSETFDPVDWTPLKAVIKTLTQTVLAKGFPENTDILNVNFPKQVEASTAIRFTRQSPQNYSEFTQPSARDFSLAYALSAQKNVKEAETPKNSDVYAVHYDHAISVTPLSWDSSLDAHEGWLLNE
jgi:5'-nucleotidase